MEMSLFFSYLVKISVENILWLFLTKYYYFFKRFQSKYINIVIYIFKKLNNFEI